MDESWGKNINRIQIEKIEFDTNLNKKKSMSKSDEIMESRKMDIYGIFREENF